MGSFHSPRSPGQATRHRTVLGVIAVAALGPCGACGDGGGGGSGGTGGGGGAGGGGGGSGGAAYAPCEERPDPGEVTEVDLEVTAPLPDVLAPPSCGGDPSELVATLSLAEDKCSLEVAASGAHGCCPGVQADQNPDVGLIFQAVQDGRKFGVAYLLKRVEIPTTSPPVMQLDFAGTALADDTTFDDVRANWCAGNPL